MGEYAPEFVAMMNEELHKTPQSEWWIDTTKWSVIKSHRPGRWLLIGATPTGHVENYTMDDILLPANYHIVCLGPHSSADRAGVS